MLMQKTVRPSLAARSSSVQAVIRANITVLNLILFLRVLVTLWEDSHLQGLRPCNNFCF